MNFTSSIKVLSLILFSLGSCNKTYVFPPEEVEVIEEPTKQIVIVEKPAIEVPKEVVQNEVKDTVKLLRPIVLPLSGKVAYGEKLLVTAQPNVDIEYSYDEGRTWFKFTTIKIATDINLLFRIRQGNKVSDRTSVTYTVYFKRVLIVGNSILSHGPLPEKKWFGSWGMAATKKENDFYHILEKRLVALNPNLEILKKGVSDFERDFTKYNYSWLNEMADFRADLIIIRIGDNVAPLSAVNDGFREYYRKLVNKLSSKAETSPMIVCTSTFFKLDYVDFEMLNGLREPIKAVWVDLSKMREVPENTAFNEYEDLGVGSHPSDKGMQVIADSIWKAIYPAVILQK